MQEIIPVEEEEAAITAVAEAGEDRVEEEGKEVGDKEGRLIRSTTRQPRSLISKFLFQFEKNKGFLESLNSLS